MENVVEDKLSFVFQPTLQYMTMAKIAIELWSQDDVIALMPDTEVFVFEFTDEMEVVIKVREKVRILQLPKPLKNELNAFIKPIGLQMFQWFCYLWDNFSVERIMPRELCWTSKGTIDKKNSALALVRNKSLKIKSRFFLACTFCLTEEITDLWKEMVEEEDKKDTSRPMFILRNLVIYWSSRLTNEFDKLNQEIEMNDDPHLSHGLFVFESAVTTGNSVATKYIFEKLLAPAEKQKIVYYAQKALADSVANLYSSSNLDSIPHEFYADLVCSLLSRMDRGQQMEVFEKQSIKVLECLLTWPYQNLFMDAVERMWEFISTDDFNYLLFNVIFEKIDRGSEICIYREIFRQFWRSSSVECRKYVVNHDLFLDNLYQVLEKGEKEVCKMILSDLNATEKGNLLCDNERVLYFYALVVKDEAWNTLEFFLEQCGPSEETLVKAKNLVVNMGRKNAYYGAQRKEILRLLGSLNRMRKSKQTILSYLNIKR